MPNKNINTLSLFTGAGGLDIGFHFQGFKIIACIEIEHEFCKTLELNRDTYYSKNCKIINEDIQSFKPESINKKIDFVIGGPPCQSYSASGRRTGGASGINDKRGTLFEHYCRIIDYYQPEGFLFENVRGLMGVNGGKAWTLIFDSFKALGYKLSFKLLDSALYGAPQHRERIILVGAKKEKLLFPFPTFGPQSIDRKKYISARDVLSNIDDNNTDDIPLINNGKYDHLIPEIPPGSNYSYFTAELGHPNPVFAWRSKFSDFLYKADPNEPVKTLQARPGKYSGPFHWENRKMTVQELKRLQTFPDDYKFFGYYNKIVKQIGNSVVPVFASELAKAVKQQLFNQPKKHHIKLMDMDFDLMLDYRKSIKARKTRLITSKKLSKQTDLFAKNITTNGSINNYVTKKYQLQYNSFSNRKIIKSKKAKGNLFNCTSKIDKDVAILRVSKPGKPHLLDINLKFLSKVISGVNDLKCEVWSNEISDYIIGWDYIELFIKDNTSYSSLIDLYGHFAEPRPKFIFQINYKNYRKSFISNYFNFICDFEKVSKLHPLNTLRILEESQKSYKSIIRELQNLRFDIRTHENSPNIKKGYFLPCYPFPRPYGKQSMIAKI